MRDAADAQAALHQKILEGRRIVIEFKHGNGSQQRGGDESAHFGGMPWASVRHSNYDSIPHYNHAEPIIKSPSNAH